MGRYRHLIVDNVEEDTPRAHDLLKQWLDECETALIVMDRQAGYRAFLGADPTGAAEFKWLCQDWLSLDRSHVMSPARGRHWGESWSSSLGSDVTDALLDPASSRERTTGLTVRRARCRSKPVRFQPQMLRMGGRPGRRSGRMSRASPRARS